jgi:hypothetical protein
MMIVFLLVLTYPEVTLSYCQRMRNKSDLGDGSTHMAGNGQDVRFLLLLRHVVGFRYQLFVIKSYVWDVIRIEKKSVYLYLYLYL